MIPGCGVEFEGVKILYCTIGSKACPIIFLHEESWGFTVCPESGGGTMQPELQIGKTLGITYELDSSPWQDCRENNQVHEVIGLLVCLRFCDRESEK